MGEIKYLVALVFLFFSQSLLSQNYEIKYEVIYKPQLNDTLKVKDYYSLKINPKKNESLFTSANKENS